MVPAGLIAHDGRKWRVTVHVRSGVIELIEQECEVALPDGITCGAMLEDLFKNQSDPQIDEIKAWWLTENVWCRITEQDGSEFAQTRDGSKIPHPKGKAAAIFP